MNTSEHKQWAKEHFKGFENLFMPSYTPDFKGIDEDGIRHDVRNSIRHGFFSCMCRPIGFENHDMYKRFIDIVCDEAGGKVLTGAMVMTGLIGQEDSLEKDLDLLSYAEKAGCSHTFIFLKGSVNPQNEDEFYEAYRQRMDATALPIIFYAPINRSNYRYGPSGVPLNLYDRLADLPNAVGIKLSQPLNLTSTFQILERLGSRLLVSPVNIDFIPILAKHYPVQWSGFWNVEAVQSPEKPYAVELINLLNRGRFDEAIKVYWQLEPALDAFYRLRAPLLLKGGHPWSHMRYFQWCGGGNGGLVPDLNEPNDTVPVLDAAGRELIKDTFRKVGIEPVNAPEEEFIVGKAAYAKGIRPSDMPVIPKCV